MMEQSNSGNQLRWMKWIVYIALIIGGIAITLYILSGYWLALFLWGWE